MYCSVSFGLLGNGFDEKLMSGKGTLPVLLFVLQAVNKYKMIVVVILDKLYSIAMYNVRACAG